jgi:2-(1,2-epoxy-1,2-dihydrophenyl)acetyl-CoA isomerase
MSTESPGVDEQVTCEVRDDGVALITIDDPENGNALTGEMRDHLAGLFDDASASLRVRAVVLTGAGTKHFCTGANLRGARQDDPDRPAEAPTPAGGDVARMIRRGWQNLVRSVLDCEKPVVAAVGGTAAGGGANLALACDLVVMAESARLIEVFVRRGIMPDAGGAYLLPRIVGLPRAKEILFLGGDVSAEECERFGIANRVVPDGEALDGALELAGRLAAGPTRAIAMTKWLVNRSFESSRHTAFEEEAYAQELVQHTHDAGEGVAAFRERREVQFKGW